MFTGNHGYQVPAQELLNMIKNQFETQVKMKGEPVPKGERPNNDGETVGRVTLRSVKQSREPELQHL